METVQQFENDTEATLDREWIELVERVGYEMACELEGVGRV